jgi:hypothetical protein
MKYQNKNENKTNKSAERRFFESVLFISIFLFIIPYALYKLKFKNILIGYLPNIDIIATVINWSNHKNEFWNHIYTNNPTNFIDVVSKILINYFALLGLTFIITKETYEKNSHAKGWALAFVMLLLTYLIPHKLINKIMDELNNYFVKQNKYSKETSNIIITSIGFLLTFLIIAFESIIIKNFHKNLFYFSKKILNILKKI